MLLRIGGRGRWSPGNEHKPRLLIFADRKIFEARGPDRPGYSPSLDFEMMDFYLSREKFVHLAGARTVRAQLDGVDLDLTDAQLKQLKAFAKEM